MGAALGRAFGGGGRRRLAGLAGGVGLLHLAGWGLLLAYGLGHPAFLALGGLAYTFGLRHAFDADHLAAIDNSTRKLMQDDKRPLGVGFFFSLGHSTIVLALTLGLVLTVHVSSLHGYGAYLGATVSGTFLWLIGFLNLVILRDLVQIFGRLRSGEQDHDRLEQRLGGGGLLSPFFGGRLF